jgi:hypothetical protein
MNEWPLLADSLEGVRSVGAVKMMPIYGRQRLRGTASPPGFNRSALPRTDGPLLAASLEGVLFIAALARRYTSKTRGPGKRYSDAARFERKKSRLRRVNDRREMKRQWPTRYLQSVSDVPQQWIRSARDTRKPGIEKVNGTMVPSSLSSRCQIHTFLTYTLSFCHPDNVPG